MLSGKEKEEYISEAKFWLGFARERAVAQEVEAEVGYVRERAAKAGVTLKKIETSEKELGELLNNGYVSEAKLWLGLAQERAVAEEVKAEVGYVREYAAKAGVVLEEIGTTLEELTKLRKQGNISYAKLWLGLARERAVAQEVEAEVGYVREYAAKAGVTLKEIGISKEELDELRKKGEISEAKTKK